MKRAGVVAVKVADKVVSLQKCSLRPLRRVERGTQSLAVAIYTINYICITSESPQDI